MRSKGLHYSCALLLSLGALGMSGCGGGGDSARVAQTVDASKTGITRIELEDNQGYAHFKGTLQVNLIGRNSENVATNLNRQATWKLSDNSLGSIKDGLFTASGKPGELELTVAYAGLSQSQKIIITNANLVSITIAPPSGLVDECKAASLTASALFDNGLTLEYPLTWAVTEGASLASFNDTSNGELNTKNSGTITVVASGKNNNNDTVNSAPLNVDIQNSLQSLTLTSNKNLRMREGESATITATGTYAGGTAVITPNTSLTANPANSLTIEAAKITAKNGSYAGTPLTLSGTCGGITNELALVILKKDLKSIEIKNSNGGTTNLSVSEGGNLDLNVTATFADNTTDTNYDYNLTWLIDSKSDTYNANLITLDQTGKLSISNDLDLLPNQSINLIVRAEVRDDADKVVTNAAGQQLVDEINIAVRP